MLVTTAFLSIVKTQAFVANIRTLAANPYTFFSNTKAKFINVKALVTIA
jgi:hypothetical protein